MVTSIWVLLSTVDWWFFLRFDFLRTSCLADESLDFNLWWLLFWLLSFISFLLNDIRSLNEALLLMFKVLRLVFSKLYLSYIGGSLAIDTSKDLSDFSLIIFSPDGNFLGVLVSNWFWCLDWVLYITVTGEWSSVAVEVLFTSLALWNSLVSKVE